MNWRISRRRILRIAAWGLGAAVVGESLRVLAFSNIHTVVPGKVYRSAQLRGSTLSRLIREKGIRTVVNLRGIGPETPWFLEECQATHETDVNQEDITLSAKRLPAPTEIRRLIDVLDHTDYPIVIHCQRGADRTGLAATVYLLLQPGVTLPQARWQLSPRYGHFPIGRTVVIDEFFDMYERWLNAIGQPHSPERFRWWATSEYIPGPYRAELVLLNPIDGRIPIGQGFTVTVEATNRGLKPWQLKPGPAGGIHMKYALANPFVGRLYTGQVGFWRGEVPPGASVRFVAGFPPVQQAGQYLAHFDLRDAQAIDLLDSDFCQYGSDPLFVTFEAV